MLIVNYRKKTVKDSFYIVNYILYIYCNRIVYSFNTYKYIYMNYILYIQSGSQVK